MVPSIRQLSCLLVAGGVLFPPQLSSAQIFDEGKFNSLISKLEQDVVDFARELERSYATRCEDIRFDACSQGNFDDCQTVYPNQQCLPGESYHVPVCGKSSPDGTGCSGLIDFSVSTVRIPSELTPARNSNPTDPQVIETVCYTRAMDEWLQAKKEADRSYWDELGVEPWAWYFGSHTGVIRLYPGRQGATCGQYDPRVRPWYVAASSGPKNVVMVLDTSGSMSGLRMRLLKEAAKRVVNTLTSTDRIAIVPFSTTANNPITDSEGHMFIATLANKDILLQEINLLEARGRTNIYDAFNTAFDVLDRSARDEFTVDCNTAILFLTDGEMTEPQNVTEAEVLELVSRRIAATSRVLTSPIILFTYSVSEEDEVHQLPSRLACNSEYGVWSKVDADDNIVDSLSNYYRLFALGLGLDETFVSWVEPYVYDPGETLGTTVSVPVYDRSKSPPLFLGVASIDVSLAALDVALGLEPGRGSQESINRVALVSAARCPTLKLEFCQLESFRRQSSAGDEGLCSDNCTADELVQVVEEKCPFTNDYPTDLWDNIEDAGLPYEDRACCSIGDTKPSENCPAEEQDTVTLSFLGIGLVVGFSFVLCAGFVLWCLLPVEDDDDDNTVNACSAAGAPPIIVVAPPASEAATAESPETVQNKAEDPPQLLTSV